MPETNKKTENKPKTANKAPVVKTAEPKSAPPVPRTKALPKVDDSVRVRVRSNRFGRLGFVNSHTGDRYFWNEIDEVQDLTVGDIRNMRGQANAFLEQGWVVIEGIESAECVDLTDKEIYDVLGLSKYYKDSKKSHYVRTARTWTLQQIKKFGPGLNRNLKANITASLNSSIKNGLLTDLSLIRAWEKALGTELELDAVE